MKTWKGWTTEVAGFASDLEDLAVKYGMKYVLAYVKHHLKHQPGKYDMGDVRWIRELKCEEAGACPFCGHEARMFHEEPREAFGAHEVMLCGSKKWFVGCNNTKQACLIGQHFWGFDLYQEAVASWNRRGGK
jgi:hypothetical protein